MGEKKPGSGKIPRGISRGEKACTESLVHYDEHSVEGQLFEAIDPVEARRILDEELYGMERVKQRIMETIIQINRTHTLPAYGLLLVGPAGTGNPRLLMRWQGF